MNLKLSNLVELPIDAATQTFAFIGRKRSGKTYGAGKLAELLIDAGVQVAVLDTVGNWYGLRLGASEKLPGIDIPILGGLRGDVPLEPTAGALVADVLVDTGRNMVIDISQFNKSDRQRFATAFGVQLWKRKKSEREPSPVHLVIEESQLIIPENVRGDSAAMVGIYEEIIRLGGNYGIGVSMISQRPQSVNKEVLNQTECLLVFQVNGAHERKALKEWIRHQGMNESLVDQLPSLKAGNCYVWSPQWLEILQLVKILPKRTFDSTSTPKVGGTFRGRDIKPIDLEALKVRMKETIERAAADDPAELRKLVRDLERQLKEAKEETASQNDLVAAARARSEGFTEGLQRISSQLAPDSEYELLEDLLKRVNSNVSALRSRNRFMFEQVQKNEWMASLPQSEPKHHMKSKEADRFVERPGNPTQKPVVDSILGLQQSEFRVLRSLYWLSDEDVTHVKAAFFAGYTYNGNFRNIMGGLRTKGLVDGWNLTDKAFELLKSSKVKIEKKPRGPELLSWMQPKLSGAENRVLHTLVTARGKRIPVVTLATESGYSYNGNFRNILGRLRSLDMADGNDKAGGVRCNPIFL